MKKKREQLLAPKEKNKLYRLNFRIAGIILFTLLTLAAVIIINVKLYQDLNSHNQIQRTLSRIDEQVHQLSDVKWVIISDQIITQEEIDQIQNKKNLIRKLFVEMENGSVQHEQFNVIQKVFEEYSVSTSFLFNLISKGDFIKANTYNHETVEPIAKKLNELTTKETELHHEYLMTEQRKFFNTGVTVTAIAFILFIILGRYLQKNREFLLFNDLMYSQISYIFDASHEAICVIDRNLNIVRANTTFIDEFGSNEDKKCCELCFNKLCHTDYCHLKRIVNGDDSVEDLVDRKHADGSVRYYLVTACRYYDYEGNLIGIIKNFKDVTERTNYVIMLRRYKILTRYARDIILFTDNDGLIIDANNAALKFYEYSKEQILSLNISDLYPPEVMAPTFDRQELEKEGYTFETVHKNRIGTKIPVEVSSIRVDFEDEKIVISIIRDMTERKLAEQSLNDQKEFAENLITSSAIPMFVLDPHHKVLIWNKACEELLGVKAKEVLGTGNHWKAFYKTKNQCLADAIIDDSLEHLPDGYIKMNQSKIIKKGLHAENWVQIGGKKKYIYIEAAPVFDSNNNLVAAVEIVQDFTERKNNEEELLKFNRKIQLELELASKVQRSMLPKFIPDIPNICFAWKSEPSIYVGGDMLDIFYLDKDKIGFYLLDVKGHGIGAALTAVTLNNHLRSNYRTHDHSYNNTIFSPSVILTQLNEYFTSEINAFFTILYGIIDIKNLVMTYARAGHCLPIIISKDGTSTVPEQGGVAVGLLKGAAYSDITIKLKQDDKVLLYTDGVLESDSGVSAKPFLINDLVNQVSTYRHECVADIVDNIILQAKKRTETLEVRDDITVLGFELN